MPRRNLYLILVVCIASAFCYRKADSAHRSRYGRMFDTFVEILEEVEKNYVEVVDERKLFEGSLDGLVGQLDENSAFLDASETTRQRQSLEQKFVGIGIEVTEDRETGAVTVVTPLVGSPALEAGVLAGDIILAINGDELIGLRLDDAVKKLRGRPGESVRIKVLHVGDTEPVELTIRRNEIKVDVVLGDRRRADGSWEFLLPGNDKVGYVRLSNFGERTTIELENTIKQLREQGARGLILDLRNNGGGLLEEAVAICSLFVKQGRIVTVRGRNKIEMSARDAVGVAPYADLPLVVLINERSASASEIVAACLQDYQQATIVGSRSFGKGTVQELRTLEDGRSLLKLTIATYWRPSDKNIHRARNATEEGEWGVTPDTGFLVELKGDKLREVNQARRALDLPKLKNAKGGDPAKGADDKPSLADPQRDKAIEAIKLRIQGTPPAVANG